MYISVSIALQYILLLQYGGPVAQAQCTGCSECSGAKKAASRSDKDGDEEVIADGQVAEEQASALLPDQASTNMSQSAEAALAKEVSPILLCSITHARHELLHDEIEPPASHAMLDRAVACCHRAVLRSASVPWQVKHSWLVLVATCSTSPAI